MAGGSTYSLLCLCLLTVINLSSQLSELPQLDDPSGDLVLVAGVPARNGHTSKVIQHKRVSAQEKQKRTEQSPPPPYLGDDFKKLSQKLDKLSKDSKRAGVTEHQPRLYNIQNFNFITREDETKVRERVSPELALDDRDKKVRSILEALVKELRKYPEVYDRSEGQASGPVERENLQGLLPLEVDDELKCGCSIKSLRCGCNRHHEHPPYEYREGLRAGGAGARSDERFITDYLLSVAKAFRREVASKKYGKGTVQ